MSLPPLPEPFPAGYIAQTEYFYTAEQMQAYGQQCREAALEEAASLASTTCHHEDTPFADGFNYASINIEKMIRSLK